MKKLLHILLLVIATSTLGYSQNLPCPDFVCESDINLTSYTVPNSAGSVYAWVVTGGVIAIGQGTNTIQVDWSATPPGNYTVEVLETDINGCVGTNILCNVTITPAPTTGPITHD